ncbi:hypothetical protein Desku_2321 [Desulfofundulus kuznetsovii DSM 6115]|uniref:Uncharacterized protein n=1 Tax=Desulfofundulus kuznetsovii (strain DSM 6115 / VKM B-1805 / 17) TaxID=760568 RepID=A0AAU8PCC1_DESK7|nr:hypothetical protein Desku_2321 [Desulfofundulus kuznetsovii DSM 6115]
MWRDVFILKFLARHRMLLCMVYIISGIASALICYIYRENIFLQSFLAGIAGSLIVSGFVSLANLIFLYEEEREEFILAELVKSWGLKRIYRTRQEMNSVCDNYIESKLRKELDIIAFGLRSLRHSPVAKIIEEKVRKGLKVRILTIHPDSQYLKRREIEEEVSEGSIKRTIEDLRQWVEKLKELRPNEDCVALKLYDGLPLYFHFRVDNHLFVGPYLYGKDSQQTISFEFENTGSSNDGYAYFSEYFEKMWKRPDLTEKLEKDCG